MSRIGERDATYLASQRAGDSPSRFRGRTRVASPPLTENPSKLPDAAAERSSSPTEEHAMRQPPDWAIAGARAAHKTYPAALASFGLAQGIDESAWFTKPAGVNNYHGIKALPGQPRTVVTTHETIGGVSRQMQCAFANFASPAESFMAHAHILATAASCAAYRAALPDIDKAADALGHGSPLHPRYATAINYGPAIASIIHSDQLTRYDA